jgi:hypothetical protein
MKRIAVFFIFFLLVSSVSAQVSDLRLGAGGGLTYYAGDISDIQFGTKVIGEISLAKELAISVGYLSNLANRVAPSSNEADDGTKVSFNNINLSLLFYLKSSVDDDFSMYVPIGASWVFGKYKANFNFGNSSCAYQEHVNDKTLNIGFGFQKRLGKPILFSEATVAFPINSEGNPMNNSGPDDLPNGFTVNGVPFHSILILGIKMPIVNDFKKKAY